MKKLSLISRKYDLGYLSLIPDPYFFHPGSRRQKNIGSLITDPQQSISMNKIRSMVRTSGCLLPAGTWRENPDPHSPKKTPITETVSREILKYGFEH
jgi:hypothetical protein